MILYFERKADKDGKRRLEVTVEEVEVQAGKRYLLTRFEKWEGALGSNEDRTELVRMEREAGIREAIMWFDKARKLYWPDESSSPS